MHPRKSIFITGGASGIGRAIAMRFGREGWCVGLGDIDRPGMDQTCRLIGHDYIFCYDLDVRDRAAWDEALDQFSDVAEGRIDVVVNNAGIPLGGMIEEMTVEEIELCFDVNLKGVFFGAQAALPHLRKVGSGSCLLNTSSAAGIYGSAGASVYSATKFGVRALTEALDGEWAQYGIKVRALMPSFIDTPLLDHAPHGGANEQIRQRVRGAGLEITPVQQVADAAWQAVHGDKLLWPVGATARKLTTAARWMPGRLRKFARKRAQVAEGI
ncbi:SDR family oxidoreductase [Erythrobacter sp. LQ02-29]|uniref:SDR family oxidoreductase n=1 Tax=Erythrobacter sp. LQ02-29 TaxID=2920384 RepID=UPI001F4E2B5B|nr:SDR family oxidoreductase [Erythrobacter sp. LQ02-29]MCP9222518.1 SDR family oxidoreductase [Erythrobacter sp. LQ02-29]